MVGLWLTLGPLGLSMSRAERFEELSAPGPPQAVIPTSTTPKALPAPPHSTPAKEALPEGRLTDLGLRDFVHWRIRVLLYAGRADAGTISPFSLRPQGPIGSHAQPRTMTRRSEKIRESIRGPLPDCQPLVDPDCPLWPMAKGRPVDMHPNEHQATLSWDVCPVCQTNQATVSLRVEQQRPRRKEGFALIVGGLFFFVAGVYLLPEMIIETGVELFPLLALGFGAVVFWNGIRKLRFREFWVACSRKHEWDVVATPAQMEDILAEAEPVLGADSVHRYGETTSSESPQT